MVRGAAGVKELFGKAACAPGLSRTAAWARERRAPRDSLSTASGFVTLVRGGGLEPQTRVCRAPLALE